MKYKIRTEDKKPITRLTEVDYLVVKSEEELRVKSTPFILWYDKQFIPNPDNVVFPGISMFITHITDTYFLDGDGRKFFYERI